MDAKQSSSTQRDLVIPAPVREVLAAQSKAIAQFTKINEDLTYRFNQLLDKFVNYDLNRIKLYDDSIKFFKSQEKPPTNGFYQHNNVKVPNNAWIDNAPISTTGHGLIPKIEAEPPQAQQQVTAGGLIPQQQPQQENPLGEFLNTLTKAFKPSTSTDSQHEISSLLKEIKELREENKRLKEDGEVTLKNDPQRTP